ncbi:MAG: DUF2849 domain-containing protein [Pseudomonadota bacterium]
MTSVRPKLKPETPKTITAWNSATGDVVWMAPDGSWTSDASNFGVFSGQEAEDRLAEALTEEALITDPYFMEVTESGEIAGRETLRERIRAQGPTVLYGEAAYAER